MPTKNSSRSFDFLVPLPFQFGTEPVGFRGRLPKYHQHVLFVGFAGLTKTGLSYLDNPALSVTVLTYVACLVLSAAGAALMERVPTARVARRYSSLIGMLGLAFAAASTGQVHPTGVDDYRTIVLVITICVVGIFTAVAELLAKWCPYPSEGKG